MYIIAYLWNYVNYATNTNDDPGAYKIIAGISFLIISILIYMEFLIFRESIISRKRKKYRLIRVFENIYLEKNAK